jgi:predicted component of type VI protein secretion system
MIHLATITALIATLALCSGCASTRTIEEEPPPMQYSQFHASPLANPHQL